VVVVDTETRTRDGKWLHEMDISTCTLSTFLLTSCGADGRVPDTAGTCRLTDGLFLWGLKNAGLPLTKLDSGDAKSRNVKLLP